MIGIKLDKHKKETMNKLEEFLTPKYVYFKINDTDEVLVKEKQKIKCGEKIIKTKFDSFIHSSVSGKVIGFEEKVDYQNNKSKFIKIENDLKETNDFKKVDIKKITKEKFTELLKENGIVGLGGAGFPTYIKYDTDNVETLIINGVECEPYITADHTILFNKIKEIVETLKIIEKIYNLKEIFIAIKTGNLNLKDKIIPMINETNIKLIEVPNLYPMGWEKSLVRYVKHTDYVKLPIEKNIIVSNASTIYAINNALNGIPLIEKIITVSGNSINNPTNIKVKIGTTFNELKDTFKGYSEKDIVLVAGGPMMGAAIETDEFVIPNNLNCVIAFKNTKVLDPITCLRCGKCADHCPAKICPVLVKDNINNVDELKRLDVSRCIECGICSFVCPSKINLREYLKQAKKKVK